MPTETLPHQLEDPDFLANLAVFHIKAFAYSQGDIGEQGTYLSWLVITGQIPPEALNMTGEILTSNPLSSPPLEQAFSRQHPDNYQSRLEADEVMPTLARQINHGLANAQETVAYLQGHGLTPGHQLTLSEYQLLFSHPLQPPDDPPIAHAGSGIKSWFDLTSPEEIAEAAENYTPGHGAVESSFVISLITSRLLRNDIPLDTRIRLIIARDRIRSLKPRNRQHPPKPEWLNDPD